MKMASPTQLWYIRASAGRYVFRWDRLLDEGFGLCSSGSSLVSRWRDAPLVREFQMWHSRYRSTLISGASMRFWWMLSTISWNSPWYIRSDCLVQQIFNQNPPAAYFQKFTGSCYSLWITSNSLWHWDYPGHAVDWCRLYFQGKYIFYVLINFFFKLKHFLSIFITFLYA